MLHGAGGSLAGTENGVWMGERKVRGEERRVWHMWVAAGDVGGVEGEQDNSGFV